MISEPVYGSNILTFEGQEEGEEGEGEWRKLGAKLERGKTMKFCAAPRREGEGKGLETQVYNAYHFTRNKKESDPLRLPK